jgi:uncharacterized lipoprotein YmbA
MNRPNRLRDLLCIGLSVLALSACRSGATRLHSLIILPSAHGIVRYTGPQVRVDAVHLPADMDRAEITTRTAAGRLEIHDFDHWGAPLSKMARETLAADLITRLPSGKVIVAPLEKPEGALGLNVVILQFSPDSVGPRFLASWQANAGRSSAGESKLITLKSDPADTPSEVASSLSELLAQLADHIATQLSTSETSPSP